MPDLRTQHTIGSNIDAGTDRTLHFHQETAEIQQCTTRFQIDEQIDVAATAGGSASSGPEYPYVARSVSRRNANYYLSLRADLANCHTSLLCQNRSRATL